MRNSILLAIILVLLMSIAGSAADSYKAEWALRTEGAGALIVLPDSSIAFTMGGKVIKADRNGGVMWEWVAAEGISQIAADEEGFLYVASGNFVTKLGIDGSALWSFDVTGSVYSLQVIEASIFVGWDYGLFTLSQDGEFIWDYYRPEDC